MYPVTNMAARSDRGNTGRNAANPGRNNSMTPRDARTLPSTGTRPATKSTTSTGASRHPASTDKRASVAGAGGIAGYRDSKVATSGERLIGSGSSTRAASYQDGYSTSTHITVHATQAQKISFILLVDKEFKVKPSSSLLNQRHTPLTKKILKGTLLEGYEVSPAGQKYVDKVKGVKQTETKHYIVKPLSGDLEFESNSSEVARISTQERDFLRALFTDSHRLQIYLDKDHISYALSLREGSQVKVLHRPDSTAPYEEVTAIVRYIGPVSSPEVGTLFGLELDGKYRGQGTSDGQFERRQYFQTDPDCALFVSIGKLVPSPTPEQSVYENVGVKQEIPHKPEEMTSVGEIKKGMIVYFQVGNTSKKGQVVFMAIPFNETEPYVIVEVETQSDGHSQRWNGKFEGHHMYTPREGVSTYCIPATAVIPEHLMEGSVHEVIQKPEEGVVQEQCTNFSRARNKGKKSSEPFFLANNRDKPRKTPSPYGSNEKLDKGGRKTVGRRDLSDHYCPPLGNKTEMRPDRTEELDLISDHYGEESKPKHDSLIGIMKGKVNKVKQKWNNGSRDDESSKSSWYTEPTSRIGETAKASFLDTRPGAADCLEDDVVQEVLDTVSKDWEKIAHSLYLSNDEIYGIASKRGTSRDRAEEMLRVWQKRKIGYDKISRLAAACRANGFIKLADDLEQGLDEDMLMKIASNIPTHKARPLGMFLNFSDAELERIEDKASDTVPFVRLMLAQWRTRQSHNSDKIMLLSNALHYCGLRQLELEVARGLDDEIMLSFAVQIGHSWKILATTLRLDLKDIHNLECFSQDKQPYQMLMLWRRKQPRSVDVLGALSKGLRESGLPDLASDLVQGVDDEMLYKLATLIGDVWDVVALHLGFSEEEIKELSDTKGSEVISIINMLNKWRERHDYTKDRFMFLMEALRASGLGQVAESFEEDKHKVELSRKNAASAKTEEYPEYPNDKGHPVLYVNRDVLVRVSKKVNFAQLCKVLDIPSEEEVEIEMYYLTNEQRVFQLLDCWKRRGDGGERSIEELLQVLAHVGGHSALIDDIMKAVEAAEEKVEDSQMKQLPPDTSIAFPSFHTEEPPEEIDPDLDVNSMVEVKPSDKTHYGVIRWIGVPMGSKTNRKIAGIELESPISQGATDGTFNKQRYFKCEPRKAIFVYLSQCKHDSRFPTMAQTFSSAKRQTSEDFGGYSSPVVEGFVDPPRHLEPAFLGMPKGIQGDQNSCYLDSTLFSMFAYNSVFDPLLRRTQGQDDLQEYEKVQKTLRESIVNPLRKNGFVRADRILELREHLDHLGTTKGLMNEEKDPEEFLHTLLSEVFKSRPQLKIRHGGNKEIDESNIYQIFLDRDESFTLPTVEQLLLQSFQEHDLKLVEVPSCLIVQMPRFGKEYKMYNRILPSLQLNITDIIEGYPRQCIVCGNLAVFECNSCKSEEAFVEASHIKNYCKNCFEMMHVGTKRERHQPTQLEVPDEFMRSFYSKTMEKGYTDEQVDAHRQKMLTLKLMDLFAVICIRTSHYVAFVKAGREKDSEWVFFDSMADRQGDQPGYNIPQISHLKDFRDWVNVDKLKRRIESKQLTELMNRLLGDAYICMYSNSEQSDQTYV